VGWMRGMGLWEEGKKEASGVSGIYFLGLEDRLHITHCSLHLRLYLTKTMRFTHSRVKDLTAMPHEYQDLGMEGDGGIFNVVLRMEILHI